MTKEVLPLNVSIAPYSSPLNAPIRGPQYLKACGFHLLVTPATFEPWSKLFKNMDSRLLYFGNDK